MNEMLIGIFGITVAGLLLLLGGCCMGLQAQVWKLRRRLRDAERVGDHYRGIVERHGGQWPAGR